MGELLWQEEEEEAHSHSHSHNSNDCDDDATAAWKRKKGGEQRAFGTILAAEEEGDFWRGEKVSHLPTHKLIVVRTVVSTTVGGTRIP